MEEEGHRSKVTEDTNRSFILGIYSVRLWKIKYQTTARHVVSRHDLRAGSYCVSSGNK